MFYVLDRAVLIKVDIPIKVGIFRCKVDLSLMKPTTTFCQLGKINGEEEDVPSKSVRSFDSDG